MVKFLLFFSFSYSSCIRRAAGYCCIQYQVCTDQTNAWSIDGQSAAISFTDSFCTLDYVGIPGMNTFDEKC